MSADLGFRRMNADDLRLMHEWLQREHVRRWWSGWPTFEEVVEHYLPAIEGQKRTDLYVVLLEHRAVGFIQTYLVSDHPDYEELVRAGPGVAGLDLFIAEPELIGKGLGSEVIRTFAQSVVFAAPATTVCVADPDVRNVASIRAFQKAGFRRTREFVDPEDGETHALMRLDRPSY